MTATGTDPAGARPVPEWALAGGAVTMLAVVLEFLGSAVPALHRRDRDRRFLGDLALTAGRLPRRWPGREAIGAPAGSDGGFSSEERAMRRWRIGRSPCRRVLGDLQAYVDGEADGDTSWRIARHLSECEDCFGDADTIRAIKDAVARLRIAPDAGALVRLRTLLDTLPDPGLEP